jgi:hypothetical protein
LLWEQQGRRKPTLEIRWGRTTTTSAQNAHTAAARIAVVEVHGKKLMHFCTLARSAAPTLAQGSSSYLSTHTVHRVVGFSGFSCSCA